MAPKILDFKCAVITGGGGGLGFAIAEYFVKLEKKVILIGRTESKLKEASGKLGNGTTYYTLDTGDTVATEKLSRQIISEHSEVDCICLNAGVQTPLDVNSLDLAKVDAEINTNIRGPVHMASHFLDHLKTKPVGVIMNVSSVLGFNPYSIINPVYNGTKAFVHFWSMAQRTQLKHTNVRVVEIVPPSVGTDLHRDRVNPDDNKKHKGATASLTVEEFMADFIRDIEADKDLITAGSGYELTQKWDETFGEKFTTAAEAYKPENAEPYGAKKKQ